MRTLRNVREGLERIVKGEKGNAQVVFLAALGIAFMIGVCQATGQPSVRIPDVQPYANGRTVQGVVVAEKSGSFEGVYAGVPGVTRVDGFEVLVRTSDGTCYGFSTAAASVPDGTGSAVSELEEMIGVGSEVEVNSFDPAYKGQKSFCDGVSYPLPVAPSQIKAK